jgi:hypothetical protein
LHWDGLQRVVQVVDKASFPLHVLICSWAKTAPISLLLFLQIVTSNLILEYVLANAAAARGFAPYFAGKCML